MEDATTATQKQMRKMLQQMIGLVPGQLFRDVSLFYQKFGLDQTLDPGHVLSEEVQGVRAKHLLEELEEYFLAVGYHFSWTEDGAEARPDAFPKFDAEAAFDSLIDLAWVCIGTAYLHRFRFDEGWARVRECNMKKVRAERPGDSKRKTTFDVKKPPDWKPPYLLDLLDEACTDCGGSGKLIHIECHACSGTGRRRRGPAPEETA